MPVGNAQQETAGATTSAMPARKRFTTLKKVLVGLAAIVVVFVVVVAVQPSEFRVARTATIDATPAEVYEQVNDFHNWQEWSPWAKLDPAAKNSFEGPSSGTGAIFRWSGNNEVGEGSSTITESRESELVRIKLDFVRPFAGTNDVAFTFKPVGDQTAVTWSMSGQKNFMAKAIGLFMDCEEMCGTQFDQGLSNMKAVVEEGKPYKTESL
jgi:hypothetical protein